MIKSIINSSIFLFFLTFLSSCTDTIDVAVPNTAPRLVIEASINWEKGTTGNEQTIKLSTSTAYFDSNLNTPITGAIVSVTKDNNGTVFYFTDENNGNYTTKNFIPEINASYTLNIQYNNQTYTAKETLVGFTNINNVVQEDSFNDDEYRIRVLFNDPADEVNYYMGEFTQENLATPSLRAVRDEFINGNEAFVLHINEFNIKDTKVAIKVFGVSESFYFYLEQLIAQSGASGSGGPFQSPPVQLKGNCKNTNNPDEEVLGYFRLSQFERTNYTIK